MSLLRWEQVFNLSIREQVQSTQNPKKFAHPARGLFLGARSGKKSGMM